MANKFESGITSNINKNENPFGYATDAEVNAMSPAAGVEMGSEIPSAPKLDVNALLDNTKLIEEKFAGVPTEEVRSKLEYANLEATARMMVANPDQFGDIEAGEVFKELNKRRHIADDRTLKAFEVLDKMSGKRNNIESLREYLSFADELAAADTLDEQQKILRKRFSSPALKAWDEAKANGNEAKLAREMLDKNGRAYGDIANSAIGMANPNAWLDYATQSKGENIAKPEWLSDERAVKEYEKKLLADELRANADAMMPYLTQEQRNLVNLAAAGADMNKFRGLFSLMKKKDRDLMMSMCQAVRPTFDGNFLSEMAVRAGLGVRDAFRAAGRADKAATATVMEYIGCKTKDDVESLRKSMLDDIDWAQSMSDLKLSDPEGFVDKALQGYADSASIQYSAVLGQALVYMGKDVKNPMASGALTYGGRALQGYTALSMIGEQFDNMLINGVPLERAAPLAVAFGSVDAYIENMNIGDWLGRDLSPAQMKRIGIRAAFRSALKKDGKEFLKVLGTNALQAFKVTASEVREEILQGMNKELGLTIAEGKNILNAAESSAMFQEGINSLVEALPTCTAFGFMASANPTGSIAAGADSVYDNHLNIIKDAVAERNGLDKLNENYAAMAEKVARNEAQRIITATAGMSRKERNDWINAQTDLTLAEKMFYAEHCDMYEASVAQDGKTWADAHLTGSINEAMWAKAGWKFAHNERGEIDSVTTKTGETFKVKFLNRSATKADFDEKGLADLVEEYNRLVDEKEITGEKLTGIDDPNIDKVTSLINGDFKGDTIVLYGAKASNATLAHESTHGLNDALAKIGTKDAKRKLLALENAYGEKLKGGCLSLSADEHIAENVEQGTSVIETLNKDASKERVELKALAKNIVTGAKKLIGRGKGVGFVPVVRTAEGSTFDPTDFLAKTIDDALVILARKEELEAAKKREISEANKRAAAEREAKRQKKIEMRKAEAEKRAEEAQVEAERVKVEAEAALKAKREELAKAAAEVHERNRIEAEFKAMWDERVKIAEDRARAAEAVAKYEEWKKDEAHKEEVLAAQEAQMNEILAEIAAEEKAEIDAINEKYEAELAALAEEEAKDEAERAAEEERQRKLTAKMDENRKKAVKTMPRLGHAKNQDGETAQRARAAYEGMWKAKTGKVLTQADIDSLAEVYGLPPEALNLKKSNKGYKLANEQLLSDDALTKFTDGLLKFYSDLKSVKIIVPDVVVATEADAANSVPNEVYDPVTDTFVTGRIVIDMSAKSFREQAGMTEPTVSVDELARAKENHPTRFSMDGGMGNGYDGYSMSVNARHAYARGEKPMSKWTKKDIIEGIKEINPEKAKLAEKMSLNALRVFALGETAWHHTSSMYNITSFYNVKEEFVENLTEDKVKEYNEVGLDKDDSKVYRGDFSYIEWVGVGRRKKAEKHHLENVIIEERGKFYYVTDANGNKVKKMIGSNGTEAINYEDVRRREEEAKIRREKILKFTTEAARKFFGMSDDDIAEKKFYGNGFDVSMDGNVYKEGRKPSRYDYAMGIENFFKQGEQRAVKNENGGYSVETWDGKKWDREDAPTMFSMKPAVSKFFEERKELSIHFDGIKYEQYSRLLPNYQDGVANKENFFTDTFGVFTKVDRPNRDPDYVSHDKFAGDVSSEYWYTEDGVIRGSGHWGANVATCSWYLKDQGEEKPRENQLGKWVGVVNGEKEYGKIKWSDLLYKTDIEGYGVNARLTSFNNPKTILPEKGRYIKDWDTRFSLATPKEDSAYMDAVTNGDMDTASQMVREAYSRISSKLVGAQKLFEGNLIDNLLNNQERTDLLQSIDVGRFGEDSIIVAREVLQYSDAYQKLKDKGVGYIYGFHVSNVEKFSSGIDGSESNSIGGKDGNIRPSSVYLFLDPSDISIAYDYILGTTDDDNVYVHRIKIPLNEVERLAWDSNFNITSGSTSAVAYRGDISQDMIDMALPISLDINRDRSKYIISHKKSLDPVTYDDSGAVIPLSKRFDLNNPDIRFSIGSSEIENAKDIAKVSNPGESSSKFSIGDRSAANVGKYILAREIMENRGKLPDTRRAAQVAAAVGYYGNVQQLIAGAEAEAKQQTTLLQYLSSDKKISKLLADAGLAARNERALARGRSAALQFSREVSEAAEGTRKATERAVRHMRGEDYETMKLREGLDMNAILLAIRPAEPETDDGKGNTNTDTSTQPITLNDAERAAVADAAAKAIARGAELVKKAKDDLAKKAEEPEAKKPEAKKSAKDDVESLAGNDDEAYGNAIGAAMAKAISEAGFSLDSPEAMVALVKAITKKYIKDFPAEFGDVDPNDVFSSPLVRAKFAANIASFATAVANAYAPSFTRLRVERNAQMLNDKGLTSMRKIEEVGESIFRDLNKDIIRQSRKEIIGSIKKILKPHAKHFAENELKQDRKGVDSALGRYCKIAYKVIEMSSAAVEERAKELEDELSTWSGVTEDEANRYREFALKKMELEMLDMFGNLRDRMPAELEELRDFVEQTVNESRWETMQFGEKWEASRSAAADAMEGAIIGDPDKNWVMPEDDEVGGLYSLIGMMETKAKQLTRFCKDSSIRETSLKAFGVVEEMIQNAEDIQFNYAQKMREKFTNLIVSVYGSESEAAAALDADIDESLWDSLDRGSFKTQWTIGRVLQMYVSCVQTDYQDNTAKWGRDGSYIALLERIINDHNPHHMEFIEGMRNLYMEMGDDLSDVMERTTGTRLLTPNRNYMPVKMMRENNIAQKARARAYSPFAPSLTPRVKNGLDFDQTADIIEVWKDRIEDTAHTIGWADVGSMIQGVCLSDRVLNAIRKAHGDKVMRQWNNYLLDILAGAERGREGDDIGAKVLRSIARLASRTWLMFNPASWAKQLAAIPCFALSGDGNLRDVTKSLSFCTMHPSKAAEVMRDLANTKAFQARYGVAISQEMKYATSGNRFSTFLDKIVNAGMAGTMKFDAFGVYALAGVYHNKRCELESQGKGADEASELASSWLMHIVDKTAQTTRSLNTTELQRAGGAWGLMLQFKSAPAQQTQFEIGAWQDWAANKGDNARLKKALVCTLINHIIVPTINTAIEGLLSCLTSWGLPEDEKRERLIQMWIANIVSGSLGSIVFLGTIIEGLTDLVGKASTGGNVSLRGAFGESLPASGVVNLYLSAGDKAARALMEITDGDIQDGAYDMVKAILSVVPGASWISRKGFQAYESATER